MATPSAGDPAPETAQPLPPRERDQPSITQALAAAAARQGAPAATNVNSTGVPSANTATTNNTNNTDNTDMHAASGAPPPVGNNKFTPASDFDAFRAIGRANGFGDRGGRGGRGRGGEAARGRGSDVGRGRGGTQQQAQQQQHQQQVAAAQRALEAAPALPGTTLSQVTPQHATPQQAPQHATQQGQRSFVDVAGETLPPLEPAPSIPDEVLHAVGFTVGVQLPKLPKTNAAKYALDGAPFVCRASKNHDSVKGYLADETWFKRSAMLHAAKVVIVRSAVATALPFIFIFDVQLMMPAVMVEQRISLVTLRSDELAIPGLAPPPELVDDKVLHLLQGTKALLAKHARKVVLRGVLAGRDDNTRVYEAIGYPIGEWQQHLLGAPLHLVQEWKHAPRRATVKPTFDKTTTLQARYDAGGLFRAAFRDHVAFTWLDGFNFRVVLKSAFTMDYKRFLASPEGIAKVFTDTHVPATPERVADETTYDELDICAHLVQTGETAMHAGLITTAEAPTSLWSSIAVFMSARVLGFNSTGCVFAVDTSRVGGLINKIVGGWARLSLARSG